MWRWSHHDQWNTPIADIWMVVLPYQIRMQQSGIAAADVTKASRSYAGPKAAIVPTRQVVLCPLPFDVDCQCRLQEGKGDGGGGFSLFMGKLWLSGFEVTSERCPPEGVQYVS